MSDAADAFLAGIDDESRRTEIAALHERLRAALPDQEVHVHGGKFLAYGHYHYRYASGREGDWFPVAIASNKRDIAVYIVAADASGYLAENHRDRLGKVNVGRSCIKFRRLSDVNVEVLVELAVRGVEMVAAGNYAE